ncbi:MAG: transcriptional regulator, MerR family [Phenylobacterium sp.]|jgi:DNA-binding transcriptional MerR regulator|nr:transcriptional regulator, MerR family [Phenylobacterium sp.]
MPTDLRRPNRTFTIRQLCLEFKCTPRALRFYEDKGLLAPARDGMNRVYSYKDRARLQLILRGKRVGLALAEIGEILDLYEVDDGGAQQAAKSLRKFRERILALENQKLDIDKAIKELKAGVEAMEKRLTETRPDLLPRAADYDQMLRHRLDGVEHSEAK